MAFYPPACPRPTCWPGVTELHVYGIKGIDNQPMGGFSFWGHEKRHGRYTGFLWLLEGIGHLNFYESKVIVQLDPTRYLHLYGQDDKEIMLYHWHSQ